MINETGQKAIKSMFLVDNANLNRKLVGEKSKTKNHKKHQPSFRIKTPFFPRKTVKSKRYTATRKR